MLYLHLLRVEYHCCSWPRCMVFCHKEKSVTTLRITSWEKYTLSLSENYICFYSNEYTSPNVAFQYKYFCHTFYRSKSYVCEHTFRGAAERDVAEKSLYLSQLNMFWTSCWSILCGYSVCKYFNLIKDSSSFVHLNVISGCVNFIAPFVHGDNRIYRVVIIRVWRCVSTKLV